MTDIYTYYNVNQIVYTIKQINQWEDYLLKDPIPPNSKGRITNIVSFGESINETVYEVQFERGFATFQLKHSELKK